VPRAVDLLIGLSSVLDLLAPGNALCRQPVSESDLAMVALPKKVSPCGLQKSNRRSPQFDNENT
jgi:hypothetical protein